MSIHTLDLGSVMGPPGISTTSGAPSPSVGFDGDVMIDPSTGIFYKKTSGSWSAICTVVLKPLDTSIDAQSANPVTNAAIAAALAGRIPMHGTQETLSLGGTGNYAGAKSLFKYGPLGFINLGYSESEENTWTRTITIGASSTADAICTLPSGFVPAKTMYVMGRILTTAGNYRAEFTLHSSASDYPGQVKCNGVFDDNFDQIMSGSDPQTQFTATGFSVGSFYRIAES